MSEPVPEAGGGGNFLTRKFAGIPAWIILIGIALLAYVYFRKQSSGTTAGATSTGGGGAATTGDISGFTPSSLAVTVNSQYAQTATSNKGQPPPRHRTPNPQPKPKPKVPVKVHQTTVTKPASKAQFVTVAKWTSKNAPWNSTLWGIAQHEHTSVAQLLKLNPQIKNANLVKPGEKVRYK